MEIFCFFYISFHWKVVRTQTSSPQQKQQNYLNITGKMENKQRWNPKITFLDNSHLVRPSASPFNSLGTQMAAHMVEDPKKESFTEVREAPRRECEEKEVWPLKNKKKNLCTLSIIVHLRHKVLIHLLWKKGLW